MSSRFRVAGALVAAFADPRKRSVLGWLLTASAAIAAIATAFFGRTTSVELHATIEAQAASAIQFYFSEDGRYSEVKSATRRLSAGTPQVVRVAAPNATIGSVRIDPMAGGGAQTICELRVVKDGMVVARLDPSRIIAGSDVAVSRLNQACVRLIPNRTAPDPQAAVDLSFLLPFFDQEKDRAQRRQAVGSSIVFALLCLTWVCWRPVAVASLIRHQLLSMASRTPIVYLALAIPLGASYAVVTPPGAVPDEPAHIAKAIAVENGFLLGAPTNDSLDPPLSAVLGPFQNFLDPSQTFAASDALRHGSARLQCNTSNEYVPTTAMSYSPISYLPVAALLNVSCGLGLSKAAFLYGGRIVNLLVAVVLVAFGLWAAGRSSWPLFAVATTPMVLFEQASFTSDSLLLGITFCMFGLQAGLSNAKLPLRAAYEFSLLGLGMVLAFSKPGFAWPCVGYLFCISRYVQAGVSFWPRFIWIVGVPWATHVAWVLSAVGDARPLPGIDPASNFQAIFKEPVTLGALLWNTFFGEGSGFLWTSVVGRLGWLDVPLHVGSYAVIVLVLGLALASSECQDEPAHARTGLRICAAAIALLTLLLPTLPMYLYWTGADAPRIEGLQGRYFIPSLAFFAVWIAFKGPLIIRSVAVVAIPIGAGLCLLDGLLKLALRYYA